MCNRINHQDDGTTSVASRSTLIVHHCNRRTQPDAEVHRISQFRPDLDEEIQRATIQQDQRCAMKSWKIVAREQATFSPSSTTSGSPLRTREYSNSNQLKTNADRDAEEKQIDLKEQKDYKFRLKLILTHALEYHQSLSSGKAIMREASSATIAAAQTEAATQPKSPSSPPNKGNVIDNIHRKDQLPTTHSLGPNKQHLNVITPEFIQVVFRDVDTMFLPGVATSSQKAYESTKTQLMGLFLYTPRTDML